MMSFNTTRKLLQTISQFIIGPAVFSLAFAMPAAADLVDQRNEIIYKFIHEMHANPLVADCAAHGAFIASTSKAIDHVEFPPEAFDSQNATITPWNDSFNNAKQRVKVDQVVTVQGLGIPKQENRPPLDLKFRCGYVGTQMLAFSWNDPVPPAKPMSSPKKKAKKKHTANRVAKKNTNKAASNAVNAKARKTKSTGAKKAQTVKKATAN